MKRAAALAMLVTACASTAPVERAYDGRVLQGRFVEPEAYAAFLRGAIAEASGDGRGAIAAYQAAADLDSGGVEIWTRLGALRCSTDRGDRRADDAFARALALDGHFGPAWEAKATCAAARGDMAGARAAAALASGLDASADDANVLLAGSAGPERDKAAREVLVSLTQTSHEPAVAWDALRLWAESHRDVALWVRALRSLARVDPTKMDVLVRASEQLAGAGEIVEARSVAAAVVDSGDLPLSESRHPLVARLAVDEAIGRRDVDAVRARASRARLALDEAAARALLAGKGELARQLASPVVHADPSALGARLVLAVAEGRDVLGAAPTVRREGPLVSGAVLVAFGAALSHAASPQKLRDALGCIPHDPIVDGDDRVIRAAVDLVAQGALAATALPADGAVELAAMGFGALPQRDERALDARHAYLALALAHPSDPRARELGVRLAAVAASDPVVASAVAFMTLANGGSVGRDAAHDLLAIDPADPLVAAAALRMAEKAGDADMVRRASGAMMVHGRVF